MGIFHRPRPGVLPLAPIRTIGGAVIGQVVSEGGRRVFERRVSEVARARVLYRAEDAWPLGAVAFFEVERWQCCALRYIVAGDGIYEVSIETFRAQAIPLDFVHERQHVLPRVLWTFTPCADRRSAPAAATVDQLPLFA